MTRERGSRAESKNCEILLFPTADRRLACENSCPSSRCFLRLTDVLTGKSNAPPGGPHFGSNSPLYGAKRESNARGLLGGGGGGMGEFKIDWYIKRNDVGLPIQTIKEEESLYRPTF